MVFGPPMGRRLLRCQIENQNWQFTVSRLQKFVRVVTNTGQTDKMRVNTVEAARLLGIKPTRLRLLLRQGKIKAPPIAFDRKTNSTSRLVHASGRRINQQRQVAPSPLHWESQSRSDSQRSRVCVSYVRHRALLLPEPYRRSWS